jgi:rhodanese-related sulfurtransferase
MKKLLFSFILGITFLTTTVSCQNAAKNAPQNTAQAIKPTVADLSTTDFQKKLAAESAAIILDVRTPEEYANGHLQNATTINFYDADFKEKASKLDKTKPVYVYCAAGGRSAKASKILQDAGFKTVYNLLGGFNGWSAAGLPSVK